MINISNYVDIPFPENCTPYWDLPEVAQKELDTYLAEDYARDPYDNFWGANGDFDSAPCRKCGQKRLRYNEDGQRWCRRCKYTFYDEYFGPEGYNTKWLELVQKLDAEKTDTGS
jgi:hypothetical protein